MEPEIIDLASFLNRMGAKVYGAGTNIIKVKGVTTLKDTSYKINWYNNRINEMIEKQMIFDSYMFLLESFYDELIKYEIDKIKN